jgi:PAS domain S-box-containing protein
MPTGSEAEERVLRLTAEEAARAQGEAARETADLHRLLVSSAQDYAIFALHRTGHVLSWNAGAERIKGYRAEEILGRSFSVFYAPEDVAAGKPERHLAAAAREGRVEDEGWRVRKDGTRFWANVVVTALRDESGELVGFGKVTRDLTERRRADARARESEALLRDAQEIAGVGSWSRDVRTGESAWSDELYRIFGLAPQSVPASSECFLSLLHPDDRPRIEARLEDAVRRGGTFAYDHRIVRPDGTVRAVHCRGRVFADASGAPVRVIGSTQDVTERRALEAQLRQAQKMEAVGQLAGGVAHDFNNLLTVIRMHAELGLAELDAAHPVRADLDEVQKAAARAATLTRQLLAFSRKQVLQPEALDLNRVVAEGGAMLRPLLGPARHLVTLPAPTPVWVFADRTQIELVLMNLAVNARDAMPDGGTLTIEIGLESGTPPSATLAVRDTGVGMPPDVQARLFEPFFTTKPVGQGTGLGLATVHGIVQQSGGTIRVTSRPGAGTTFIVALPLSPDAPAPVAAPPGARVTAPVPGPGTVLLVDDEEAMRGIGRRVLERAGYRVLSARHGADALRLVEEHGASIDVLLSDVVMPEMGGLALAARAVERVPGLPVVLMSGYADADVGPIGQGGLVHGFVPKPFTAEALLDAVNRAARSGERSR